MRSADTAMTGKKLAHVLALAIVWPGTQAFLPIAARAENYPDHAVRIIVPFGAGGPADVAARLLGNALQESLGQPFVIENHTGAGGAIEQSSSAWTKY